MMVTPVMTSHCRGTGKDIQHSPRSAHGLVPTALRLAWLTVPSLSSPIIRAWSAASFGFSMISSLLTTTVSAAMTRSGGSSGLSLYVRKEQFVQVHNQLDASA